MIVAIIIGFSVGVALAPLLAMLTLRIPAVDRWVYGDSHV